VVPVIRCLQQHWPNTKIVWIIGTLEHRLLEGLKGVEFIVFDKRGGFSAIRQLRKSLKKRSFDVLLQMQLSTRANLLSRLVKAPVRLGWNRARSREFHHYFINRSVADVPLQHQVDGFLEFPRALGLDPGPARWDLPISKDSETWAKQHIDPVRKTLIISPCSSHKLRNWHNRHYAQVADYATGQLGMQVILSGGPGQHEREAGASIENLMQLSCLNLIGKDTLDQSKALLQSADLLISPDSGPVHIASALGTPVIGLYAATWSRRSGPYTSLDLCVDHFDQAAREFRKQEPGQLRWGSRIEVPGVMDLIKPEEVISSLQTWFDSSTSEQPRPPQIP
jgi:heptosyltransferase I